MRQALAENRIMIQKILISEHMTSTVPRSEETVQHKATIGSFWALPLWGDTDCKEGDEQRECRLWVLQNCTDALEKYIISVCGMYCTSLFFIIIFKYRICKTMRCHGQAFYITLNYCSQRSNEELDPFSK